MSISNEYLNSVLRDWTKNMWAQNNAGRFATPAEERAAAAAFDNNFSGTDGDRNLTRLERFSERSFVALCYGLAMLPSAAGEKASDSTLVNAWRKSMQKNSFRHGYDVFAQTLKETLDAGGAEAAIKAYPAWPKASAKELAAAIDAVGYSSRALDNTAIKMLLQKAAPAPKQSGGPAAPSR